MTGRCTLANRRLDHGWLRVPAHSNQPGPGSYCLLEQYGPRLKSSSGSSHSASLLSARYPSAGALVQVGVAGAEADEHQRHAVPRERGGGVSRSAVDVRAELHRRSPRVRGALARGAPDVKVLGTAHGPVPVRSEEDLEPILAQPRVPVHFGGVQLRDGRSAPRRLGADGVVCPAHFSGTERSLSRATNHHPIASAPSLKCRNGGSLSAHWRGSCDTAGSGVTSKRTPKAAWPGAIRP